MRDLRILESEINKELGSIYDKFSSLSDEEKQEVVLEVANNEILLEACSKARFDRKMAQAFLLGNGPVVEAMNLEEDLQLEGSTVINNYILKLNVVNDATVEDIIGLSVGPIAGFNLGSIYLNILKEAIDRRGILTAYVDKLHTLYKALVPEMVKVYSSMLRVVVS